MTKHERRKNSECRSFHQVALDNTEITDDGLKHLSSLTDLQVLSLTTPSDKTGTFNVPNDLWNAAFGG